VIIVGIKVFNNWWRVSTPYPYKDFNWTTDYPNFIRDFYQIRNFFHSQVINGDLPDIGVFPRGSQENEIIWKRLPFSTREIFPGNSVVVSLDFETGKLYAGFSDLYLLNDKFPKRFREEILSTRRSSSFQNAKGEPYEKGTTLLTLVAILSSDDVSYYKRKFSKE
jgi:hypothetical protein